MLDEFYPEEALFSPAFQGDKSSRSSGYMSTCLQLFHFSHFALNTTLPTTFDPPRICSTCDLYHWDWDARVWSAKSTYWRFIVVVVVVVASSFFLHAQFWKHFPFLHDEAIFAQEIPNVHFRSEIQVRFPRFAADHASVFFKPF